MIELKKLCKSYFSKKNKLEFPAIVNANAHFGKNEFVTILGPSGSGKTTLLNAICGLDTFDSGEVIIDGVSTKKFSEHNWDTFRSEKIGFIFQDYNLIDHLNVVDNVAMALAFSKTNHFKAKTLAMQALQLVGLKDHFSCYPDELSGGQKQCVSIARAILKNPEIILADEPTGALDTETSKMVMEALKKAGQNRLVIMTTHNTELAEKYSTSKYTLVDGKLSKESTQISTSDTKVAENKNRIKRSKLTFSHACNLALSNMAKHKVRTGLTILATSIGIIVISFVLSISTGLTNYINLMQETTLSSSPITIGQLKTDSSSANTQDKDALSQSTQSSETNASDTLRQEYLKNSVSQRRIALNNTIANLFSKPETTNTESTPNTNDVASLKSYLDSNPDDIQDSCASIEYTYNTSPVIYANMEDSVTEVYPGGLFGSLGTGSSSTKESKASTTSAFTLSSVLSDFRPLPEDPSTYEDDDSVVEGKWPQNSSECALVLNPDGTMDDTFAYILGLKNFTQDISPLIEKYQTGEKVEYPGIYDSYSYKDVIGTTFKVISPSDVYQKQSDGLWADMSSDQDYMQKCVSNGQDLIIVGIIIPKDGSKASAQFSEGIYYHSSLNYESIDKAASSQIVKEQLTNPATDVLSGKSFAWLKQASTITQRFDFSNIININTDLLASCVTIHPEVLDLEDKTEEIFEEVKLTDQEIAAIMITLFNDPDFQKFIEDLSQNPSFDADIEKILAGAGAEYTKYYAEEIKAGRTPKTAEEYFSEEGEGYHWTLWAKYILPEDLAIDVSNFVAKYAAKISNFMCRVVEEEIDALLLDIQTELEKEDTGPGLIEFDDAKFAAAIKINITEDDIAQFGHYLIGNTSHTYNSNLSDFGYADLSQPITCTIYPKTFKDKEIITSALDSYNTQQRLSNEECKVISYTDLSGTLANFALAAIVVVGSLLIAFVLVSLFSVIIMIAIIAGISTLQRSKEIGIIRALGACKRDVFVVFDSETAMLGFISSVFGLIVAGILCTIVNLNLRMANFDYDVAQLTPGIVLGVILAAVFVTALAGFIPSFIASRKSPVKCL